MRVLVYFGLLFTYALSLSSAELVKVRKIWSQGEHNAFTDLIRFKEQWLCVFREGKGHVSPDGSIRLLSSTDGETWSSKAHITSKTSDLRDPKIVITPKGELMIYAAAALPQPGPVKHQSVAYFSKDGINWGDPVEIGEKNVWIWRMIWNKTDAFAVGYDTSGEKFARLYQTADGREYSTLVSKLFEEGYPNESGLVFLQDGSLACLLRRDGPNASGKFGVAPPPFTDWKWKDVGPKIGGPQMISLPDQRLIAAVRLYDDGARTAVVEISKESGKLTELVRLPSGGDCSYPGLVWHEKRLFISYYSSHQGKTEIYFAEVNLD